jgi:hypothetical protein
VQGKINVRNVVMYFGGQAELSRRISRRNSYLTVKGIQKWQERGQIPGTWLIKLTSLAASEGRKFELSDFMEKETHL